MMSCDTKKTEVMKKILMIAVMAVVALTANAQSLSCQDEGTFSVKPYAGLSLGMLITNSDESDMRAGFTAGAEAQYMVNEWFAVSGGLAYAQQGGQTTTDGIKFTFEFDYINMPILANFYVCKGLALKVGLQPSYAINQKLELNAYSPITGDISNSFRKFDLAMPVGISYEHSNVVIDARVNAGIIGVFDADSAFDKDNYTNGVFQVTLGYRF